MEKKYLIFTGSKRIFADTMAKVKEYTKGLKSYEFSLYRKVL